MCGGGEGIRTPDLYSAIVALSQLSYTPADTLSSARSTLGKYTQPTVVCQQPGALVRTVFTRQMSHTGARRSAGQAMATKSAPKTTPADAALQVWIDR